MKLLRIYLLGAVAAAGLATMTAWSGSAPEAETKKSGDRVTEPMRAEHRTLIPHIEALAAAGDVVGTAPLAEQRKKVHESYVFLTTHLTPHAVAEDKVLYAKVDSLIGSSGSTRATDTMRRDHEEIATLTDELGKLGEQLHHGELSPSSQQQLRRVLYSLHGIVALHFAKEEEVYLPLIDRTVQAAEAQQMFEQMGKAAAEAGAEGGHQH